MNPMPIFFTEQILLNIYNDKFINVHEGFENCAIFNNFIACELPLKSEQERQKRNLYICGHAPINPPACLYVVVILNDRL